MQYLLPLIPALALALPPQLPEQSPQAAAPVILNVIALDSKNQSVTDLTAADLRVLDNGKPQTIAAFRRRDLRPSPSAPLGPRQYSNRSVNTIPHATLILFDQLNMQFADRGYVSNAITHALEQFESGDNLYLYLITVKGELYPVHALPGSEGDTAAKDGAWTHNIQTTLSAALRVTLGQRPVELDIDSRVRSTFATLSVVASRLAGIPGRKTIVWLTHGVPISLSPARTLTGDWVDYTPYVRRLSNTLDRADVSIYAVQQSPPGSLSPTAGDIGRSQNAPDPAFTGLGSEETLTEFANLTGGRAFLNNDVAGAIKQAMNDVKQSYLLSYVPPPDNWDGKYHKIRLSCTRKGVKLQARQGYFAFAGQEASAKQAEDAIASAVTSPFDAGEIGLRATAAALPGEHPLLRIAARVDLADVQLTAAGDTYTGQLEPRFILYLDDGTIKQSIPTTLNLHLTAAALREGYEVAENFDVNPHLQKIRVIVFDPASSALGSLTIKP